MLDEKCAHVFYLYIGIVILVHCIVVHNERYLKSKPHVDYENNVNYVNPQNPEIWPGPLQLSPSVGREI